jgi:hypothetical protein
MSIDARTAKALAELGRAAARHVGIPDDVVITMSVCQDREYDWCGLVDGEKEKDQTSPTTSSPHITRKVLGPSINDKRKYRSRS